MASDEIAEEIAKSADLSEKDTVLEIGPGRGILTKYLLAKAGGVVAVEKDKELYEFLKEKFSGAKNLRLLNADIRDFFKEPRNYESGIINYGYKIVANIPYYLTSYLIKLILENPVLPQEIVLTIQKEVAERICAAPPKMSILAVSVQIFGKPKILKTIPAKYFLPPPEVDSAVLRITPYKKSFVAPQEQKKFFQIVKSGFSSRRKQIINTLSAGLRLEREEVKQWLKTAGIDPTRRAETLDIADWLKLKKISNARMSCDECPAPLCR